MKGSKSSSDRQKNLGHMNTVLRKYLLVLGSLIALGLVTDLIPGQSTRHRHRITPRGREYSRLVANLRAHGGTVQLTNEKVRQPFFSAPGRIINLNNEGLQIFEYANAIKANEEAQRISPDGMTIGTTKPSWMATPHFYKSSRLIVLYLGDNRSILEALKSALGTQVAGG
ncbi:MAG: hypothetical protein ACR2HX_16865 [Pyrinomonadaceae bacterium]